MKPRVFIGSSVEGLDVAYAVQQNLERDSEPTVWPQGAFIPSDYVLPALEEALDTYDFGIFVFSPDDMVEIRQEKLSAVRDNVLLELGLFIGRLGRKRNYILMPRGQSDFRMPTDLLGLITADYDPNRQDKNLQAATGPATNQIRLQINQLGPRNKPTFEEAVVSRAKEEVKVREISSVAIPEKVLEQLDKAANASTIKGIGKKPTADLEFSHVWKILDRALSELNRVIQKYGLRTSPNLNIHILQEWSDFPSCIQGSQSETDAARPGEIPGVLQWMADARTYTSPIPGHKSEWIATYLCQLCYSGLVICGVGHHIIAPNYDREPWTQIIQLDSSPNEILEAVNKLTQAWLEQAPSYYEALAASLPDATSDKS
jgi:hypothetical protein